MVTNQERHLIKRIQYVCNRHTHAAVALVSVQVDVLLDIDAVHSMCAIQSFIVFQVALIISTLISTGRCGPGHKGAPWRHGNS